MSREIKFRGKRLDNGEWVYGYYLQSASAFIAVDDGLIDGHWELYQVDPATVGQFIGFKELYNGDIVRITAACDEECVGEVVWDEWHLNWAVDIGSDLWDFANIIECEHRIEVIGNRWENPDLLT